LAPFGQEFNFRTFTMLLIQPQPRRRVFLLKAVPAGVALLSVWLAFYLSCQFRFAGAAATGSLEGWLSAAALVAVVLFSGALWTTLLFRQITASLLVTYLAPMALSVVMSTFSSARVQSGPTHASTAAIPAVLFWVMLAYAMAGFGWARWQLIHAQDTQWTGGMVLLPSLFGRGRSFARRRGPFASLIGKELRLHQINVLLALVLGLLYWTAMLLCSGGPIQPAPGNATAFQKSLRYAIIGLCLAWLFIPGLFGATAVAEERRLGVMESFWHIPMGRLRQWLTKFVVVQVLIFVLVAVALGIIDAIATARGVHTLFSAGGGFLGELTGLSLMAALLGAVSFYASTLSRNTLQAIGIAVALCLGTALVVEAVERVAWLLQTFSARLIVINALCVLLYLSYRNYTGLQVGKRELGFNAVVWLGLLVLLLELMAMGTLQSSFGIRDDRVLASAAAATEVAALFYLWCKRNQGAQIERASVKLKLLAGLGAMIFIAAVSAVIIFRPWQLVMASETPHGPPQLNLFGRAAVLETSKGLFVLQPDGRLWAAQDVRMMERKSSQSEDWDARPERGTFLGNSNWMDLVNSSGKELLALQSDGSLWRISVFNLPPGLQWTSWWTPPPPDGGSVFHLAFKIERIGTDSDWAMLADNYPPVALKQDGSLWGWGESAGLDPGNGAVSTSDEPVRIGTDSDWVAVSDGSGNRYAAVKRDGSVWKWGTLPHSGLGTSWKWHAKPLRWTNAGTNWVMVDFGANRLLALHERGGVWSFGGYVGEPALEWMRSDADFQTIENGRTFPEYKRKGGRIELEGGCGLKYSLSKYSDWVTPVTWRSRATLAADGTLACWNLSGVYLMPSRRPLWSINILNDK
jgi:hypothetical protein